jgi:hypothetical protein
MQHRYIKQLDMNLSPLGFGLLRVDQNEDGSFPPAVHSLLPAALERGINYFDTAYVYHGGHSETLIHDALVRNYPRESFHIADKLPVAYWNYCKSREDMDKIFDIQLKRLGVDFIDFYLLHFLTRMNWPDIYDMGVLDFLEEKKREGRVRKVGFSMHDDLKTLKIIESAYSWDIVQLQVNYYDWYAQDARSLYSYLVERDIPCIVMAPVGGGRLINLPAQAAEHLHKARPYASLAEWALHFVAGLSNVAVTLSGMTGISQLEENSKVFHSLEPLSESEKDALDNVVQVLHSMDIIPCSACRYCVDVCPHQVDIVQIFDLYNDINRYGKLFPRSLHAYYNHFVSEGRRIESCVSCGKCTPNCPQKINIPKELWTIQKTMMEQLLGMDIELLRGIDRIALFGSGADGRLILSLLRYNSIEVHWFCDNNSILWGSFVEGIEVISPDKIKELDAKVLITSSIHRNAISSQLIEMGITAINSKC